MSLQRQVEARVTIFCENQGIDLANYAKQSIITTDMFICANRVVSGVLSTRSKTAIILGIVIIAAVSIYFLYPRPADQFIVSTTTSLYETGLLDVLKQRFEQTHPGYNVSFISQGTGKAIATAQRGDADMILVHDPVKEQAFLEDGYGVNRKIIAYNFFIIVGPETDPAGANGATPIEALTLIKAAGENGTALWVSRGDESGTHAKEQRLWAAAGYNYEEIRTEPWYLESGTGMTATLQLADEEEAYTLCDLGSYLSNYGQGNIQLVKHVEAGKDTLNVYAAIACNPQNITTAKFDASMEFIKFLLTDETQSLLQTFGVSEYGEALFKPWIPMLTSQQDPELIQWVKDYAYFNGTECPTAYQYNAGDLY
jgi:tungstate transport system substrate-binding protein